MMAAIAQNMTANESAVALRAVLASAVGVEGWEVVVPLPPAPQLRPPLPTPPTASLSTALPLPPAAAPLTALADGLRVLSQRTHNLARGCGSTDAVPHAHAGCAHMGGGAR